MSTDSSKIEDRYCRCIMHVAKQSPRYNPYAVCTSSVYNKQGMKRNERIECAEKFTFEDFPVEDLRGYAKLKKIPLSNKMNKNQLVKVLYAYVASKKKKPVWETFLKEIKAENPNLSKKE